MAGLVEKLDPRGAERVDEHAQPGFAIRVGIEHRRLRRIAAEEQALPLSGYRSAAPSIAAAPPVVPTCR